MANDSWDVMPRASEANMEFVPHTPFEEYSEKYKDHVIMERRDGVIMVRFHTHNKPILWGAQSHRALPDALRAVSADRDNEVMILTGTGEFWVAYGVAHDPAVQEATAEQRGQASLDYMIGDGMPLQEILVNEMRIPTIAAINGPGYHMDMGLMCDLVICTDDTVMIDVHRWMGFASGDGINVAYQETMGSKRANYAMLMGNAVPAQKALDWGMVNEIMPREKLQDRAWELAAEIMLGGKDRRAWRRMMTEIMRKPLKTRMAEDFFGGFAAEMYGYMADSGVSHDDTGLKAMWEAAGIKLPKWQDL
ncbi:MAG: enoyl-CoA hydratase/isomerase family protein [Marinicaulis sp.]|nr:enoyl-CoA hydratase/isomerase family protein [Marinicaulis sp.]NNL88506.1 enoyl-CoA hydratase/isomerase family protein [Marinicaulis sp.]